MSALAASATALERGLSSCHACGWLGRLPAEHAARHAHCPRCQAAVHSRKPDSLSRTWALTVAAAVFYVPANLLPVMTVVRFGKGEPHTILGGVEALLHGGQWPLAALVFFASILVPVLKLFGLSYLTLSVQLGSQWRPSDRTRLYRIVEAVGRWSMIDIFMISILVALVKLGAVSTIEPGAGATFFAAVVVLTMLAAETFDPRLIWDACRDNPVRAT
ncbi:MAG: paraquat-inducible protein A [Gammaproteobacteria bacterium]